jgi:hypothetical protein
MDKKHLSFLKSVTAQSPIMWVFDLDTQSIVDMTPATAVLMDQFDITSLPSTVSYMRNTWKPIV